MIRRALCLSATLAAAILSSVVPVMATETYAVGFAAATGTGELSALGSPYQSYAQTSANSQVYSAAGSPAALGAALAPIAQLSQTATMVTYASTAANDQFAVFGAPAGSAASFGAPFGAPAGSGDISTFASQTNTSTVTNGYQPNVAYASTSFGSPFGSPFGTPQSFALIQQPPSSSQLNETPEPSTWVLVGTALAGVMFTRRRRATK
jgi:PEP-CTERM motif